VERAELDKRVHATYDRLKHQATVDAHLIAVTGKQVTEDLRQHSKIVHMRSENAE
jgi:hypothetical protein